LTEEATQLPATSPGSRIEFTPLHEQVRRAIWQSIVGGRLNPGERIVESRVARELGVSQGTVREALRSMEQAGVVKTLPRRGAFVSHVSRDDAMEIYTMRTVLEAYAVELAMARIGPAEIEQLQTIVEGMRRFAAEGDVRSVIHLDVSFHRHLCEYSGHRLLLKLWSNVDPLGWTTVSITRLFRDRLEELISMHQKIIDALCSSDVTHARQVMEHHITDLGKQLTAGLAQDEAFL
jgi:DNA-binding GntR family transcriptional regulator